MSSFQRKILVTGGAGFIGSNFILHFLEKYPQYFMLNLDKLTYAGDLENLKDAPDYANYDFIKGDIQDYGLIEKIFVDYKITDVIHFAAESHVDNSIKGPEEFIKTNVNGTFNLIDVARKSWMKNTFQFKKGTEKNRFHHISTDEVYGTLGKTGLFKEDTPYAPNSPYSASKAASDMLVRSYHHTYGLNTVTTNCSNNYGPRQHSEKLIPTIIRKALTNEPIPIYGDGKNIRDWLYVDDHCKGIDLAFHKGKSGDTYNIGGKNERDNNYIANKICEILDELKPLSGERSYKELITYVEDRPGHDRRYAIDASKIERELGWKAGENFENGIMKTVEWYLGKFN